MEQIAVEFFLNSRFDNPCALFFDRFLLNNNLIYSRSYFKKGGKSVNYCIKTASGRLVIVDKLMLFSENCPHGPIICACKRPYIIGTELAKTNHVFFSDRHVNVSSFFLQEVQETRSRIVVDIDDFLSKCLYLSYGQARYAISLPNHYEWD